MFLIVIIEVMVSAKLCTDTEIGDGIVMIIIDKHISRFDVLMNDGWRVCMQISQSRRHITNEFP